MSLSVKLITDETELSYKEYYFDLIESVLVLTFYHEYSKPSKRYKKYHADYTYTRYSRCRGSENSPPELTEDIKNQAMRMLMKSIRVDVKL